MNRRHLLRWAGVGTAGVLSGCLEQVASSVESLPGAGGSSANPWGKETLVVSVDQEVPARRGFVDLVRSALDYWEENDETYLDYDVTFRLRPNADGSDVAVVLVDEIRECGEHDDGDRYAGCASVTGAGTWDSATVRVADGYADEFTTGTLEHELGHVLGLGHDAEPAHVMSDRLEDRIPDYRERTDALDSYAEATADWNDGIRYWEAGIDHWNGRDYRGAERDFARAENQFREAVAHLEAAVAVGEEIDQRDAIALLRDARAKIELYRSAAASMQTASEHAARRNFESAERHRSEAGDAVEAAGTYEFASGEELAAALGLPRRQG